MAAKSKLASHASPATRAQHPHSTPAKVYRTPLRIMTAVPIPGLEPEDITVEVAAGAHLILRGQRRSELKGIKDELLNEWGVGDFYRKVTLPAPVNGALANVTYGNGVLVVALPIAPRTKRPRSRWPPSRPRTACARVTWASPSGSTRGPHSGRCSYQPQPYARKQQNHAIVSAGQMHAPRQTPFLVQNGACAARRRLRAGVRDQRR